MSFENAIPVPPAPAPAAATSSSDKALMILSHVSSLIGVPFVLPFIVWLVKKGENDMVAAHAKEALNFHISWLIYSLCCIPLCFLWIGIPLIALLAISGFVLAIIAAIKASDGILYRYPVTIRLID
jgi:uncharacterized Tic20 family protein